MKNESTVKPAEKAVDPYEEKARIASQIKGNLSGFTCMWPADYQNYLNNHDEDQLIKKLEESIELIREYKGIK